MTVGEWITFLKGFEDDRVVVLTSVGTNDGQFPELEPHDIGINERQPIIQGDLFGGKM